MYLISVYFDEKTNKIIQRYIDEVAVRSSNDFMTAHNVPPHLTVSSIEAKNPNVLIPAFNKIKGKIKSEEIYIPSTAQLLPYVFCLNPVLNEYLQGISWTVYEEIKDIPETSVSKFYKPWSWYPHITIAKKLDKNQMKIAFDIMQEIFLPVRATITEIGLAKVNPHEDIERYTLTI